MNENAEETRPWLRVMKDDCPVGAPQQAWIEASMTWFASEFGREPMLGGIVLPGPSLASGYEGTPRQINRLVARRVHGHVAGAVRPGRGVLRPAGRGGQGGQARGRALLRPGRRPVIGLDVSEASDAEYLTAIIAHELCHVRLLGEGRITTERKDHERLTDLLTVYFGFGIFSTNAALRFADGTPGFSVRPLGYLDERALNAARSDGYSRVGYLTEPEFGYAMACYAWLREETEPSWARHLDPGPRTHLEQGLAYLSRCAPKGQFPTTRTGAIRVAVRMAPNTAAPGLPFPVFTRGGARPAR
ncbi:hypothetical protein LUX57_10055 [Actinomadura madurae]|uniref:hypothetical protein n=1 Tax=Actinomadura madurae TaxID=1993 RepID=UPI0020D1FFC1|nr:hypothetical protein [Actinomadura madurae]MCP9965427.1 hypothetical protein [Actinomadura madurae]